MVEETSNSKQNNQSEDENQQEDEVLDKKKLKAKYKEQLEKLEADVSHWKNEYYRAYADTQNLRNSLEKEHREAMKYRAEGFIDSLLPVLDSFHLALNNEPDDPKLKNYLIGFQFIYRNLVAALESEGVNEFSAQIGEKFNPSTMDAVDSIVDKDKEVNTVSKVLGKGYRLHERLVRPCRVQVIVEPKKEEDKPEKQENNEEIHDA